MAKITWQSIKEGFTAFKDGIKKANFKYPDGFLEVFGNVNNQLIPLDEAIKHLVKYLACYDDEQTCLECNNVLPAAEICLFCGFVLKEVVEPVAETEAVAESPDAVEVVESETEETADVPEATEEPADVPEAVEEPVGELDATEEPVGELDATESEVEETKIPAFVTNPGSKAHIVYTQIYYGATMDAILAALKAEYPKDATSRLRKGTATYIYNWNKKYGWGIKRDDNGVYKVS